MKTMTLADWASLEHFKPTEAWGDPHRMSSDLVRELEAFREFIDTEVFILCGTQGVHSVNSQHYSGNAVDIIFPGEPLDALPDLLLASLRFDFVGIGIYPHWSIHGHVRGGLHLDQRPGLVKALWLCTLNDGKQSYGRLSWKDLNLALIEAGTQEPRH